MRDASPPSRASAQGLDGQEASDHDLHGGGADPGGRGGAGDDDALHCVSAYLDGELAAAAEQAFVDHLVDCARCQLALHGEVQLRDREDTLRKQAARQGELPAARASSPEVAPPPVIAAITPVAAIVAAVVAPHGEQAALTVAPSDERGVIPITRLPRQRRRWIMAAGALGAAAAAASLTLVRLPAHQHPPPMPIIALAATRSLEARLTWQDAAQFREYSPTRSAADHGAERLDPETLAALARRGDCAGVAAMYLLSGALELAEQQYQQPGCQHDPILDADRAALAVTRGQPEQALELADRVLADRPRHEVALWNRALALRDLGLGLTARATFLELAAMSSDFREEAAARAEALGELQRVRDRYQEILRDRNQIIPEGPLAPRLLELAKAVPARARLRFDDALRTATTARRLDELRPLAEVLDQRTGSKLVAALAGARKRLSPARAALAPLYVEILRQQGIADEARWRTWKARAQAAGATDLLLGALYLARGDSDEAAELAAASGDSWMRGLLEKERFNARSKQADHAAAARHVATLEELCAQGAAAYICLLAQIKRAEVATDTGQPTLALRAAQQALQTATAEGEFDWRGRAVFFAAEAHRFRKHLSLARAYYEEWALSSSDPDLQQKAIATVALMELERGRISEAEAIVEKLQASDTPPGRALLSTQVDLLEAGLAIRRDDLRKALAAALAAAGSSETDRLYLEYLAARVDLRADQAEPQLAARQQLVELSRRAAAFAGDATARRTQVEAERALFVDAARRERWDDALALATQSHRVPRPTRCALALVHDRYHAAAVLVSADGSLTGTYRVEQTWSLPKEWPQRLAGCAQVGVIAYPPSTSAPPLPGTLPWAFLLGQPQPASPELSPRTVIIANTEPPQSLQLAALAPLTAPPDATLLVGAVATPQRAAMEAKGATLIEFHVHTTRVASSDAPALALSESPAGWALTAEDLASWDLPRRPVVLLADCVGAVPAGYDYLVWGLPVAFRAAGARAVVAALTDIPDVEGAQVFAEIREGLRHDPNVARVVSRIRAEKISADPTSWVRNIVVFE